MKNLQKYLMLAAALPLCALAQTDRIFDGGIDDHCATGAEKAVVLWKQQGLADAEVQKRYQQYLAQCSGADAATALYVGAANLDYFRFARLVISGQIGTDLYVGLVRDRERKVRNAKKNPAWLQAYASGDADGDMIPDALDKCPGTPDLTRTDDQGCPVFTPLAPQAPREQLIQVLNKMNLMTSPKCDAGKFPAVSAPLKGGFSEDQRKNLAIAVTKVPEPAGCVGLYEVQIYMSAPGGVVTPERIFTVVFRSTENTDLGPTGANREVFRVDANSVGVKRDIWDASWIYNHREFRVRALNGNGLSSGWSGWKPMGAMFGEN
jgi:hypothetical protein